MSCLVDYFPFILHVKALPCGEYRMDIKSIVQALIIAGVTSSIVMYGQQKSTAVQLEALANDVGEIKQNQKQIMRDFYAPRLMR